LVFLAVVVSAFGIWLLFKYEVRSMNLFSRLMAKGWDGIEKEESNYIRCSDCTSVIKRGHTTPYCTKCRKFM